MMESAEQLRSEGWPQDDVHGRVIICHLDELRPHPSNVRDRLVSRSPLELHPHPSWVKHNLGLSVDRLSAIAASWNPSKLNPVSITRDGTILKGHEVCELARRMGLERLSCLEYDLNEEEALLWIIQNSHQDQELNPYHRVVLALDYEPLFRERARENQRLGGLFKGSTTLPEAHAVSFRFPERKSAHLKSSSSYATQPLGG